MALLRTALQGCLRDIQSNKITERKRGLDNLKEYILQEDNAKTIHSICRDPNSLVTWDALFWSCHNAVLLAADKLVKDGKDKPGSPPFINLQHQYMSMVTMVVRTANYDDQYLNGKKVVEASLHVLENPKYRTLLGEKYVKILDEFILPFRNYWDQIKHFWKDLYSVCREIFKDTKTGFQTGIVISMLNNVIKIGYEHSPVALTAKKNIYGFLKTIMKAAVKENDNYQSKVLTLLVTVCQKLQKECRMATCKFGEEVLDYVMPMYPMKVGITEKKELIFDFLTIIVEAHHPHGVDESFSAAYADDWILWKKQLQRMNSIAIAEINSVLKYEKSGTLCSRFLNLIVRVYKQNIHSGNNSMDVTMGSNFLDESILEPSSSKRIRITIGFPGLVDRLNDVNRFSDMWPWLCVTYELLSKYPTLVNESDYIMLLENISKFLSTSKDSLVTDYLCKCCIQMIRIRESLNHNGINTHAEGIILESIWQTVLRTIGLNQSIEWSHSLLQHMLNHLWKPSRSNAVLKLYLSGVIRLSNHSLYTLNLLRKRISFPDSILEVSVWPSLMSWIISKDTFNDHILNIDLPLYAHTLIFICLKNNIKCTYEDKTPLEFDLKQIQDGISTSDIFSLMSYDSDLFFKSEQFLELASFEEVKKPNCVLNREALDQVVNFLEDSCTSCFENCITISNKIEVFKYLSRFNLLLLHVQKLHVYYGIEFNSRLANLSSKMTEKLVAICNEILSSNGSRDKLRFLEELTEFFKCLGILPEAVADPILKEFFLSLQFVFQIIESGLERTENQNQEDVDLEVVEINEVNVSLFDMKLLSDKDKLRVVGCKVLLYFCYNHDFITDNQYNVLIKLLEILDDMRDNLSPLCLLQMAVLAVDITLRVSKVDSNAIKKVAIVLLSLCEPCQWYSTQESAVVILKFTQKTIRASRNIADDSAWDCLKVLVAGVEKATKDYGPSTITEVVHCLGLLLKIGGLEKYKEQEELSVLVKNLLSYLKHHFHEVRMTAVIYIREIFKLIDVSFEMNLEVIDKDMILANLYDILLESFYVEDISDEEIDEPVTRPMVVLYASSTAICFSKSARRELLYLFFNLTHEKRLNKDLAHKILKLVKNTLNVDTVMHLVKDNSLYLLWNWFKKYRSFQNFPYEVVKCNNLSIFYRIFLKDIVPVLSFYGESEAIKEIADILGISVSEVTQTCFPELMALLLRKIIDLDGSSQDGINETEMHNYIETSIFPAEIKDLMIDRLSDVLIELFHSLHDPDFEIPPNSILPSPSPWRSDERQVLETIDYLQNTTERPNSPLIVIITCEFKHHAQKVFQQLYIDVMTASTPEIKLESFQKYALFCLLLLPYYEDLLKSDMVAYICRTVIMHLLHFVSQDEAAPSVALAALKFFRNFTSRWLTKDKNKKYIVSVFHYVFSSLVNDLITLGMRTNALGAEAISTLKFLLIDKYECLERSIKQLEPFPDLVQFKTLNEFCMQNQDTQEETSTLIGDINKFFVNAGNSKMCRLEGLISLKNQLRTNRHELRKSFKELISRYRFSEECCETWPHRLICLLLELASSADEKIKHEATCCLGEIGLVDLHTLVLKPNRDTFDTTSKAELLITTELCRMLKHCSVEKEVDVIVATSEALYSIFLSQEGHDIVHDSKLAKTDRMFLFPFIAAEPKTLGLWSYFDAELFQRNVDNSSLWSPETQMAFNSWIVNLTCSVLTSFRSPCYLNVVEKICRIKASFAEKSFKYLVNLMLNGDSQQVKDILSTRINEFFRKHFASCSNETLSENSSSSRFSSDLEPEIHRNKLAVQCLLDVVHFVRLKQQKPDLNELKLDYLYVAKAAQYCSLYFTSVLYAELWINHQIKDCKIENDGNVSTVLEKIAVSSANNREELLVILREAFSKIGDSDALGGCGSSLLLTSRTRITHYAQMENWPMVMESCDILLRCGVHEYSAINDLSAATGLSGFTFMQHQFLSSISNMNSASKDQFYESGWKLQKWDLPEPSDDEKTLAYYQYAALKDIKQRNPSGAKINIENARRLITPALSRTGLESVKNIYGVLSKLQCLQDLEDFLRIDDMNELIDSWRNQDEFDIRVNIKNKEMIFDQRICMVQNNEAACNYLLDMAKLARKESNVVLAQRCIASVQPELVTSKYLQMKLTLEEAKLLWKRQETDVARYMLRNLLKNEHLDETKSFHSKVLRIYGSWLSEINLENADNIFNDYFKPAIAKFDDKTKETEKERKSRLKTFKCVGEFADSQYQQICKYITSDDFKRQQDSIEQAKRQSNLLDGESMDVRRTKMQLANQSKMDQSMVTEIEEKRKRYLLLAMEFYLQWLIESDDDLRMFRVISLFVENKDDGNLNVLMKKLLMKVPTHKFIIVLPQLSAHITRLSAEGFGNSVKKVIEKCAKDHPHHTIPLILSLAKYSKDDENNKIKSSAKVTKEERVLAACEFMKKFMQDDKIGEIARQMEKISEAYIELAYSDKSHGCGQVSNLESTLLISKLNKVEKALCPTINLPVSKTATYNNIIGIYRIESKVMFVGGINAPKKISCVCTDGITRSQLVKGRDDIRQDAVMQQVFTIMNKLLSENKHTSKRKLLIRTYKVVPLSQRSGILEWCSNTTSLGDYLTKSNEGAHKRYRPNDLDPNEARCKLNRAAKKNDREKLELYNEICSKLKPVFRYFFLEKFPSPTMWFERKLAYTHSVAVTSIVGYIIGLGDRHVQNILIDEITAEVIHIDFGIAFDQGLLLHYAELIPFRLTRDIEDGMGVFSIDGIFRRCCEQTLQVMRQNKNIIQTTIEVFLYDPLYQWTVTPEKKASLQSTSRKAVEAAASSKCNFLYLGFGVPQTNKMHVIVTEVNVTAPRALAGVISKLQGLNEGTYTTIEGQVNRLIQQAKDPNNLSRLFCGWQAYL